MTEEKKKNKQAFEASRFSGFLMNPNDLVIIGLDTDDGPEHPLFDERSKQPLDPQFVGEIRALGILQAVKVRKNGDKAEVVAGRQRVRAAREVNKDACEICLVPVTLDRGSDDRMRDITISENEHRVNDSIEVKLKKLERYLASGRSEQEAAQRFRVSLQTIKNWLTLLEAGPEVTEALQAGTITPSAAVPVAKLPRAKQGPVLAKALTQGAPTVANVNATIRSERNGTVIPPSPSRALLKRIANSTYASNFDAGDKWLVRMVLRYVLGEVTAESIPPLMEAIKALDEKKPEQVEVVKTDYRTEKEKEPGFGGPECFGGSDYLTYEEEQQRLARQY